MSTPSAIFFWLDEGKKTGEVRTGMAGPQCPEPGPETEEKRNWRKQGDH